MKFKKPINENYAATVVRIKNVVQLDNCDNIQSTHIFGNSVIISKDVKINDIGVYFPIESQLSHEYCNNNNLYRHSELNIDKDKKGYIEDNRRIRAMKLRGHKSMGLFMPLESFLFCVGSPIHTFDEGDIFDEIKGIPICNKYVVIKKERQQGKGKKAKAKKESKLLENQFRFHEDTAHFGKNAHLFQPDDIMSITYKLHGTSVVISKVNCKKKIGWFYKLLRALGVKVVDTQYDNVYASRKTIKNDDLKPTGHFYDVDIWGLANEKIKEFLLDGMTVYAEIVGYLPTGAYIQKPYDYGCASGQWSVYIYRITFTNTAGNVFEFSAKQVQDWCKERGLKAVPELYYGRVIDVLPETIKEQVNETNLGNILIDYLKTKYLEQDCYMCKNKLPAEGVVIRRESNIVEAFKFKSFRFLERETKMLDKGEADIEEEN